MAHFEIYSEKDIDELVTNFFDESKPGELLQPVLDRVVQQWSQRGEDEREDFRSLLHSFSRLYGYLSQLIDFVDVELEKLYVFGRHLSRKLPKRKGSGLPLEVTESVDLDSFRIQQTYEGSIELEADDGVVDGISTDVGKSTEPDIDLLSNILTVLNDTYGLELTEKDKLHVQQIVDDVENDEGVRAVLTGNNSMSNKRHKVDDVVDDKILAQVHTSLDLFKKLPDPAVNATFKRRLFTRLVRQFSEAA